MKHTKRWSELSPRAQSALMVLVSIEVSLTATALVDLIRCPSGQVRGRKIAWAPALLVQPVGPIAYLALGRRHVRASTPAVVR